MVKSTAAVLVASLSSAAAFPAVMQHTARLQKRDVEPAPRAPLYKITRPNTGLPPSGFDAQDQYVDVTDGGANAWIAPGPTDKRGQCPGLNAAANHGFLNRNGLTSFDQAVTGLGAAYNMGVDLSAFLAAIAIATSGDPVAQTWSIGDGFTPTLPLFPAGGILSTHNKYEGDASIMRGDAYLNGGSPGVFQLRSFEHMYSLGETFGFAEAAAQSDYETRWSILNNPYYFSAPFSGLVAPAAHDLVINLMSNHSADVPGGTLTRATLMSFFSVTGTPGNFVHTRGHERMPLNWYRRPTADAHSIPEVLNDLVVNNGAYPGILRFGGNTGETDTFTGIDTESLTNGAFNAETLLQGNNLACFFLQASLAGLPNGTAPELGVLGSVLGYALNIIGPLQEKLECPELGQLDNSLFNAFPGASYTGGATADK